MDWQIVKQHVCDGRRFTVEATGARLLTDVLMPSGHLVHAHLVPKHDCLTIHDGGAAFNELSINGLEVSSVRGVRDFLAPTNYLVTDGGLISIDNVPVDEIAAAIIGLADASQRAANYLLNHAHKRIGRKFDRQLKDALKLRFPAGHKDFRYEGRFRQHRFDFGFAEDGQTVLVEAVMPDIGSISQAVVKSLDVLKSDGPVRPVLVYDSEANWPSDLMNMLSLGGAPISFARAKVGELLAA